MNIVFTTDDFGDEAASLEAAALGRPLADEYHIYGFVVIEHPGEATLRLYDDLPFLVQSLCAQAPKALRRSGSTEVRFVDAPNTLTLRREGDTVTLSGEMGESARYPAELLLGELRTCAERFATFLDLIVQTAPQFAKRSEWFHAALAEGTLPS
jgi:hypothetical protein